MNALTVKKLLVASDSADSLRDAIDKAAVIEHATGARVTALLVSHDGLVDELRERAEQKVAQQLIDDMTRYDAGVLESTLAEWRNRVVRNASMAASILGAELHVVSAFPPLAPYVSQYQVSYDFASLRVEMHEARREALAKLLADFNVEATTHILEGHPRDVIASLAAELHASVTVLGTAGRTGLKKLLVGNTAEAIIGQLATDLMTVRAH